MKNKTQKQSSDSEDRHNSIDILLNDPDFIELAYTIKARKEGSINNLAKALCKYLDMIETKYHKVCTYNDILKDAKKEQKEIDDVDDRTVGKYLSYFPRYLADIGLAESTIELYYNNVVRFYKRKNVQLPYNGLEKCNVKKSNFFIPEKSDIQSALKHGSIVLQALILSQISSGVGTAEVMSLTRDDFWKGYDKVTGVTTLNPTRKKTNEHYYTFLNPEASKAVIQMLKERTDDDPRLFKFRSEAAITSLYSRLDEACGYVQIKGQYGKIRSHNMRKYFNQTMRDAGMPVDLVDYLSGRKETSTRAAYSEKRPAQLKEIYMEYMDALYVTTDVIKPDQETIDNLKAKNRELEEQVAQIQKSNEAQVTELKKSYDEKLAQMQMKTDENSQKMEAKVTKLAAIVDEYIVHKIDGEDVYEPVYPAPPIGRPTTPPIKKVKSETK
ncbi:MAG: Phage integrase family protein [Methanomethylovorans sp. PtaU1.Bin073]|nr:MAG: Phage integrase family protein [Methanomethylovorans sp. PtaU1.Bin073]